MRIARHPIDIDNAADVFRLVTARLGTSLSLVGRDVNNLYSLHTSAMTILLAGSVVAPDSADVARALRLAARLGAGAFAFARPDTRPMSFTVEDGLTVSYTGTTDESLVDLITWMRVFYVVTVARDADGFAVLDRVPYQFLMQSSTRSRGPVEERERAYRYIDVLKALWTDPDGVTRLPVFAEMEAFAVSGSGGKAPNKYVECITAPLLRVMRQVERRDDRGFTDALTEAVKGHKRYWSMPQKQRAEFEGFVSLPLTAVAALAWDRGLRFHVESDYLPWSWVTGEVFRPAVKTP